MCQIIEKTITATKVGMAAFKRNHYDGALFNAYDNINECFKLLEDAIAAVGVNTPEQKHLTIGINTDAHNWYLEDLKKYEWDGPKVSYDHDQLIEFYEKLVADHPLLEYIEDGFSGASDIQGIKKCIDKFQRYHPQVIIGTGHMF